MHFIASSEHSVIDIYDSVHGGGLLQGFSGGCPTVLLLMRNFMFT